MNFKKEKFENVYHINYEKTNNLIERVNWTEKAISDILISEKEKNNRPTVPGEIRKYMRKDGKISIFLILQNTTSYEPNVLICPLYIIKNKKDFIAGYKVGFIPQISCDFEFLAAINEIRFERKSKLEINNDTNEPICHIMKHHLIGILYMYRSLLEHVIKMPCSFKRIYSA